MITNTARNVTALLLVGLALASCRHVSHRDRTGASLELAQSSLPDGTKTSWRLYPGPGRNNAPRIDVTRTTVSERPTVGLVVSPVTRQRAESHGIEPWKGVWVDTVGGRTPAAAAGITPGDVVLSVAGQGVSSAEQFADLVRTHGVPGEPLELVLLVYRRQGEPLDSMSTATLELVPDVARDRGSSTESVVLDYSPALQTYTGLQVGSVTGDLARDAYGSDEPVVTVTGVVTGSPAYRAGLRLGDRVTEVDGAPVESLDSLRLALHRRIRERPWPLEDLTDLPAGGESASASEPIALKVVGPLGPHEANLRIDRDMRKEVDVDVPILLEYHRTIDYKRVSFLDFIFQFGFNYRRNTEPSRSREPVVEWKLSLFPLGMFEFEKQVDRTEWTLFWLIEFETAR